MSAPQPSSALIWLSVLRLRTLPAAVVPVAVGTALCQALGVVHWGRAALCALCALLIQIGTNLFNDYADFKRGADTAARLGPARATQRGWLTASQVKGAAIGVFGAAALAGVYLVAVGGWPVLCIGLCSIAMGFAYTGGPYPLAYNGLGEVFVFLFFGLVAVGGTVYVQALQAPPPACFVAGAAIGLLAAAILVVNNLRDLDTDALVAKRTLAVRIGPAATRVQYVAMLAVAYLLVISQALATGAAGHGSPGHPTGWLLPLLSLPLAVWLGGAIYQRRGADLNALLGRTALLELLFGALLSVGVCL
jgi:1,4-dihydroxy-2-naphthoate octaprenyltransferase